MKCTHVVDRRDRGDIVLGWLTRLVVVFALLGVVGYDAMSVLYVAATATDTANKAAMSASEAWHTQPQLAAAYNAAETTAEASGGTVPPKSISIYADGTVRLSVQMTATTLVLHHLGPLKKWSTVVSHGQARFTP